eukprot:TRINITY_DN62388_c0_g1_i1.p1 TRINITY_DN62388_c0_g1~~TRINITY_DN62388_c0_g1_i1.p1  ORF type:complete len:146 (+),score=21.85 TRINITY_DN62388_c0_g1_i1:55-438(+)
MFSVFARFIVVISLSSVWKLTGARKTRSPPVAQDAFNSDGVHSVHELSDHELLKDEVGSLDHSEAAFMEAYARGPEDVVLSPRLRMQVGALIMAASIALFAAFGWMFATTPSKDHAAKTRHVLAQST